MQRKFHLNHTCHIQMTKIRDSLPKGQRGVHCCLNFLFIGSILDSFSQIIIIGKTKIVKRGAQDPSVGRKAQPHTSGKMVRD